MQVDEIFQSIRLILSNELKVNVDSLQMDTEIRAISGGIDSLDVLRIISKVEQQFDVELEDDIVFNIQTISDFINAIQKANLLET